MNTADEKRAQLEALYGPLAQHSDNRPGDHITYTHEATQRGGMIVWVAAPSTIAGRSLPTRYIVEPDGIEGFPDEVWPSDIILVTPRSDAPSHDVRSADDERTWWAWASAATDEALLAALHECAGWSEVAAAVCLTRLEDRGYTLYNSATPRDVTIRKDGQQPSAYERAKPAIAAYRAAHPFVPDDDHTPVVCPSCGRTIGQAGLITLPDRVVCDFCFTLPRWIEQFGEDKSR